MSDRALPFRHLAITPWPLPPAGALTPWIRGDLRADIAVLLRGPGLTGGDVLRSPGAAPLLEALVTAGVPTLLSCTVAELGGARPWMRAGISGVQFKGDPSNAVAREARERMGPAAILGCSCHGAPRDLSDAWSYATVSPIFDLARAGTEREDGKPRRGMGLGPLRAWSASPVPVLALGGISSERIEPCLATGAHGVAGIRLFFGDAQRVEENMAKLRSATSTAIDAHTRHASPKTV